MKGVFREPQDGLKRSQEGHEIVLRRPQESLKMALRAPKTV